MRVETFHVDEIHCESCAKSIRTSLGRLEGILSVEPDQATDSVRVGYDDGRVQASQIVGRLADAGFPPTETSG